MRDFFFVTIGILASIILLAVIIITNRRDKKKFIEKLNEEQEKLHSHKMNEDNI